MFRIIVFFLILYLLYLTAKKLIRYFFHIESLEKDKKNDRSDGITELVKCSVCETFISKDLTIKEYKNNELYYLCSKACQEKFKG